MELGPDVGYHQRKSVDKVTPHMATLLRRAIVEREWVVYWGRSSGRLAHVTGKGS